MKEYLTIAIHGRSKAGKTTLAATAPGPILVLDAEAGGMRFVEGNKVLWDPASGELPDGDYDIYQVQVRTLSDIEAVHRYLLTYPDHPFKTVVFDSLTELQARLKRHFDSGGLLDQQGWGKMLAQFEDLVWQYQAFAESPRSSVQLVVFLAGTNDIAGKKEPLLQGAMSRQLPYKVDVLAYLDVQIDADRNERRKLVFGGDERFGTGSRVPTLSGVLWDPRLDTLFDQAFGRS